MSGTAMNTTDGTTHLGAAWAFFLDELRRGAMAVAGGLLAVVALALVPRLMPNALPGGGDELRLAAAVAGMVFVLPLVGLYLATSGWARERADGTLGWLYTRPLSSDALFWLRTAAFATSLAIFAAVVLVATWTTPGKVFADPEIGDVYSFYRYTPVLFPFLAVSLFVSATAGRGRLAPMLAATVGVLASLALVPELPLPTGELLADLEAVELRRALLLYAVFPLALLVGAWVAVRGAVIDRRTRWRGVWVAAAIATAGALLSAALAVHQIWGDPWRPVSVHAAAGGELRLSSGHGYAPWVLRLELAREDGGRVLPGVFLVPQVFTSPRGEVAVFEGVLSTPRLRWFGRGGEERAVVLDEAVRMVGWSPDGRHFAARASDHLLLLDADTGSVRPLALPWLSAEERAFWSVAWLDDRHLFLSTFNKGSWWNVVDVGGRLVAEGRVPEADRVLPNSGDHWWMPEGDNGTYPVAPFSAPRRDGELLLWVSRRNERRDLVAVGADGGFEVLAEAPKQRSLDFSLGVVGDTVVWFGDRVVRALPATGEERTSCAVPSGFTHGHFRGAAGRVAVWAPSRHGEGPFDRLFACDLASGEGELVGDLGPWGSESAQVTDEGLLTPSGLRRFGG